MKSPKGYVIIPRRENHDRKVVDEAIQITAAGAQGETKIPSALARGFLFIFKKSININFPLSPHFLRSWGLLAVFLVGSVWFWAYRRGF